MRLNSQIKPLGTSGLKMSLLGLEKRDFKALLKEELCRFEQHSLMEYCGNYKQRPFVSGDPSAHSSM